MVVHAVWVRVFAGSSPAVLTEIEVKRFMSKKAILLEAK